MDPSPLTAAALEGARQWFRTQARTYPWTETEDPYALWISEVMLQQTVVTAAVAPFRAWMERWPDVASLAAAREDDVMRAWEGLGYASRAKNLHRAAQVLAQSGRNTLPHTEDELRALPGVGEYTAAAVLSFAFHQPTLTLDANLKRVFQRLDAAPEWTPALEARWRSLWAALVDGPSSRESNQTVMQLGQRVCRAKSPLCGSCPLAEGCRARRDGSVHRIPLPRVRTIVEKQTSVVFWHRSVPDSWWLAQPEAGRFSHLWLVAPGVPLDFPGAALQSLTPRVHTYTKYRDRLTPYRAVWDEDGDPPLPPGWTGRWATAADAHRLGMVSVYRKIFDEALSPQLLPFELRWKKEGPS